MRNSNVHGSLQARGLDRHQRSALLACSSASAQKTAVMRHTHSLQENRQIDCKKDRRLPDAKLIVLITHLLKTYQMYSRLVAAATTTRRLVSLPMSDQTRRHIRAMRSVLLACRWTGGGETHAAVAAGE